MQPVDLGRQAASAVKANGFSWSKAPSIYLLEFSYQKDVKAAGKHETCALGEGIVPVEKIVRFLVETGWEGTIGIEHEPYDRDPMVPMVILHAKSGKSRYPRPQSLVPAVVGHLAPRLANYKKIYNYK